MWAAYWSRPPYELKQRPDLEFVGVISGEEDLTLGTQDLDAYFQTKDYNDLSADEQELFRIKAASFLERHNYETDLTAAELYDLFQQPEYHSDLMALVYEYPYKKSGTSFVFRKLP